MKCPFCAYDNIEGADQCSNCGEDLTSLERSNFEDSLEAGLQNDELHEIARCKVYYFKESTPMKEVVESLNHRNTCGLVVTEGQLKGIVTLRDLLQKIILRDVDLENSQLTDYMTKNPSFLKYDDKIAHALHRMSIDRYRHIIFQNADAKTYSVVSAEDVLAYLETMFSDIIVPEK
ncbi:MAG: CBS domain-containing protein [Deltaproteobacteria bacterium]|nr:CBS domain-containing protein [Deltaproteobacteria bacterium]